MKRKVYILSYRRDGGISCFDFCGGRLTLVEKIPLAFPYYAAVRDGRLYVVIKEKDPEANSGGLLSFEISGDGRLVRPTAVESTNGVMPCHLEASGDGVYVANYGSGNISGPGGRTAVHKGKSVHPTRQAGAHTHFIGFSPDKKHLLCTDLGLDKIIVYGTDLTEEYEVGTPAGSGPRHLCFSGDGKYFYCVNELSGDVCVFEWNGGRPVLKGTYPAIPGYKGESYAAEIGRNGVNLYVSNRGADTISRFIIDGDRLVLAENTYCGGAWPTDFGLVDGYIVCANEKSDTVTVLKTENGKPVLTGEKVCIDRPVCVAVM